MYSYCAQRLSPRKEGLCHQELTLAEQIEVLMAMVDDKPLGLNGYPCELYKATWEFVGPNILNVYKEVVQKNSWDNSSTCIWFKFIPKVGDPKLITNNWPITFLNVSYKLMAKALALWASISYPRSLGLRDTSIRCQFIMDNVVVLEGIERA